MKIDIGKTFSSATIMLTECSVLIILKGAPYICTAGANPFLNSNVIVQSYYAWAYALSVNLLVCDCELIIL